MRNSWWKILIVVVVACTVAGVLAWRLDKMRKPSWQKRAAVRQQAELAKESEIKGPLPKIETAKSEREFTAQRLKFFLRYTVEAYKTHGRKDPAWDKPALELLDSYARRLAGTRDAPDPQQFLAGAQPILDSECDDPLVSLAAGTALYLNNRMAEAQPLLSMVDHDFSEQEVVRKEGKMTVTRVVSKGPEYSDLCKWQGDLLGGAACGALGGELIQSVRPSYELAIRRFCRGLEDTELEPGDERVLFAWIQPELAERLRPLADTVVNELVNETGIEPWLKQMLLGEAEVHVAWKARGGGVAYEVTEDGWTGFKDHLAKAREYLTKAYELRPEYPEAPARMINVVMGGDRRQGETKRMWFDRAVEAQFDYLPAYNSLRWALRPRWGGSHEEMYEFGKECLATGRFDTRVPPFVYMVACDIAEDVVEDRPGFWKEPGVYADMVKLFEGMLADTDSPWKPECTKTIWAVVAWRTGKYAQARRLLDELGDDVRRDVFKEDYSVPFATARGEIVALSGPQAERIERALALAEDKPDKALAELKSIVHSVADKDAARYLRGHIVGLGVRQALEGDDWYDITPASDLAGWRVAEGKWQVESDGMLSARHGKKGTRIILEEPVEGNFEIRGTALLPGAREVAGAGAVYDYRQTAADRAEACGFVFHPRLAEANLSGARFDKMLTKDVWILRENTLRVQVWGSQVTCYLNDEPVFVGEEMEQDRYPEVPTHVGLGAPDTGRNGLAAQYRNVQIRRLKGEPPKPSEG